MDALLIVFAQHNKGGLSVLFRRGRVAIVANVAIVACRYSSHSWPELVRFSHGNTIATIGTIRPLLPFLWGYEA